MNDSQDTIVAPRVRRYLAGLASGYFRAIVTVFVTLWLTPFTLRHLDRESFAVFMLAGDVVTWLALLDLGITAGLRAQAARLSASSDPDRLNRLASTAFFVQAAISVVVLSAGVGIAIGFPRFFPLAPDVQPEIFRLVFLLATASAISMGTQVFSALLVAHQRVHVDNLVGLGALAVRTVVTISLLEAGWRLSALGLAAVASALAAAAFSAARTYRDVPGLRLRPSLVSRTVFGQTARLGVWFTLGGLAGIMISSLDRVVAGKVLSVESVTSLTLTNRAYVLAGGLLAQITDTARPVLGQALGQRQMARACRIYRELVMLSGGAAIIVAMSLLAVNDTFVRRWVGVSNYGGFWLDLALAFNLVAYAWVLPSRAALTANLVAASQVPIRLLDGFLNLGLSVVLARAFGLPGVAFGTGIAALATSMWMMPRLTARMFSQPFGRFLWADVDRPLSLALAMVPVVFVSRALAYRVGGFPGVVLAGSLSALAGLVLAWLLLLDRDLKARATELLRSHGIAPWRRWFLRGRSS